MRLLEYQVDKFYKDCIYKDNGKHKCAEKGFNLGTQMFRKLDFWLKSKDCTDKDFIREVYRENLQKEIIPETELFEILTRFLCGYDKQVDSRKEYLTLPENKKESFFLNIQENVDSLISNQDLLEKLDYIENCLKDFK